VTAPEAILLLASGGLGAAAGRVVRLPMWPLTGSIVGAAVMHVLLSGSSSAPSWWGVLAQVLVGAAVGAGIAPGVAREFAAVLVPGVLCVVAIIGVGIGCGLALSAAGQVAPVVAVFGMVPGGVGEMVAAATSLHADSALVAGMHVARLLVVLWTLPWLVRLARFWSEAR